MPGERACSVYGTPPALKVAYIGPDRRAEEFESADGFPWTVQAGPRTVTIFNQLTHARAASRLVQAPKGAENRPALLVRLANMSADDAIPLLWRQPTPLPIPVPEGQDPLMVRFGPRLVALPFTIRLTEFRKKDYPGTDMAMSYESDVNVTLGDGSNKPATISMNEPFKGAGWKVYQSGFIGSDVSVFSIMKDPGLPLTYVGCIGLCIGIVLTFYSRPLSTGHPASRHSLAQPTAIAVRSRSMSRAFLTALMTLFFLLLPASEGKQSQSQQPDWKSSLGSIPVPRTAGASCRWTPMCVQLAVQLTGRTSWPAGKGPEAYSGKQPVELITDLLFKGTVIWGKPLIAIHSDSFRRALGLQTGERRRPLLLSHGTHAQSADAEAHAGLRDGQAR